MRRRKEKNTKKMPVYISATIIFLIVVLVGVGVGMFFMPAFRVAEVYCEGNQRISQEELVAAAEVPLGKSILLQRLSGIKIRVAEIPMVEEVKVRRIFPNKIKIWIRERVPAAYLYDGESSCVVIDLEGKVLEIMNDERVAKMKEFYTPVKVEKEPEEETSEDAAEGEDAEAEAEVEEATETPTPTQTPKPKAVKEPERAYTIPFVVGLQLEKPEVGKVADSKERDKLSKVMETFRALETANLLVRSTYMDVTDMSDLVLVVENRLEIYMGEVQNIEYRCRFLATVIEEKISVTEHVIMDYRGNDIYVRQPDDGKKRMIPKPSEEPESTEEPTEEPTEE